MTNSCLGRVVLTLTSAALVACSSSSPATMPGGDDAGDHVDAGHHDGGAHDAKAHDASDASVHDDSSLDATSGPGVVAVDAAECSAKCPTGYVCTTANGIPVCRAPSGVPLLSHVFLIMEENTSLSTLQASLTANAAPNFEMLRAKYATGSDYHGVTHPSLPNYIALTSGSDQGVACDCSPVSGMGVCTTSNCNLVSGSCSCAQQVNSIADQLETANKTWTAFGEGMGTPCNLTDDTTTNYAVRHVPFLYYDNIQSDAARCAAHVVDYSTFDVTSAPEFTYIAPNLIDDMHNPFPATQGNITAGDTWIGPVVAGIMASDAYKNGGLIVIAWDEDDDSGIIDKDAPIPIFVISPYAKSGGYVSAATMDHYSLLATFQDGFNLPRLANSGIPRALTADTLADYFARE